MLARLLPSLLLLAVGAPSSPHFLEAWFVNPEGRFVPRRLPVAADGTVDDAAVRGWTPVKSPAFLRVRVAALPSKFTAELTFEGKAEATFDFQRPEVAGPALSVPIRFDDPSRLSGRTVVLKSPNQPPLVIGPLQLIVSSLAPPPVVNRFHLARVAEAQQLVKQKGSAIWPDFDLAEVPMLLRSAEAQARFALTWSDRFPAPTAVMMGDGGRQPTKFERLPAAPGQSQPVYVITDEREANALDRHLAFAYDPFGMLRGELVALSGRGTATVRMTPLLGAPDLDGWGAAEENLATMIHEAFHVHQFHGQWMKRKGLTGGNAVLIESPFFTSEQAALFECERRALRAAHEAADEAIRKARVREFLACRWTRWKRQADPGRKDLENLFESIEGLAAYVAFRALAETQADYIPLPALADDLGFLGYRHWDNGAPLLDAHEVPFVVVNLMEQKTAYYNVGTLIGLALDRVLPNWKAEFETTPVQLDQLLARAVGLKSTDTAAITALVAQAKSRHDYAAAVKQAQIRLREMK